jgi:hypothetical protein
MAIRTDTTLLSDRVACVLVRVRDEAGKLVAEVAVYIDPETETALAVSRSTMPRLPPRCVEGDLPEVVDSWDDDEDSTGNDLPEETEEDDNEGLDAEACARAFVEARWSELQPRKAR